jgi:hypothetical protein
LAGRICGIFCAASALDGGFPGIQAEKLRFYEINQIPQFRLRESLRIGKPADIILIAASERWIPGQQKCCPAYELNEKSILVK